MSEQISPQVPSKILSRRNFGKGLVAFGTLGTIHGYKYMFRALAEAAKADGSNEKIDHGGITLGIVAVSAAAFFKGFSLMTEGKHNNPEEEWNLADPNPPIHKGET